MDRIFKAQKYGRVKIRLNDLMDERNITRGALAAAIGSRFEVVDRWYQGTMDKLDLDVLARICCVLECQVSDILEYEM